MEENSIHALYQSAYRGNHSTGTALLKIHNDISRAISSHQKVTLVLLDLSAAFDTLIQDILLGRLRSIGLSDTTLAWFRSYFLGRTSTRIPLQVPAPQVLQGSVLGPLLFTIYCLSDADIITKYGVQFHMYADDTQLYLDFSPEDEDSAHASIAKCVKEIKAWLSDNFLRKQDRGHNCQTSQSVRSSKVYPAWRSDYSTVDFRHKPWCSI